MLTYGIDVSSRQAADTPGVMPGISFALIKATEGHTYTSPVQREQAAAARKRGLTVGFYHFLWPGNIPEQAAYFVTQCASVAGDILVCDWETTTAGTHATGAEKDAFLAEVKRLRPDHKVMLYCNLWFWKQIDTTSDVGDGLWIADPSSPAGSPNLVSPWVLHQYASTGGIDRDVYKGSPAQLHMWATAGAAAPTTASSGTSSTAPAATYTIRSGDTMTAIAAAHHVSLAALESANPQISNPNVIMPGQVLRIP